MCDQRGLADQHPRPGVVDRPEDRRPGQRLVPLDAGCGAGGGTVASNGNSLSANYNVSSAILQAQTGRPLTPGLAQQTVNLLLQGHTFPDTPQLARPSRSARS